MDVILLKSTGDFFCALYFDYKPKAYSTSISAIIDENAVPFIRMCSTIS